MAGTTFEKIAEAAQLVIGIGTAQADLFPEDDREYLLGMSVYRLGKSVAESIAEQTPATLPDSVDPVDLVIQPPNEGRILVGMLESLVFGIEGRWGEQEADYWDQLEDYNERVCAGEIDEDDPDAPPPRQLPIRVTHAEVERLKVLTSHLSWVAKQANEGVAAKEFEVRLDGNAVANHDVIKPKYISDNDARDKFVYEEWQKRTPEIVIRNKVNRTEGWEPLGKASHTKARAVSWADRRHLPPPDARRPRKKPPG